MDMPTSPKVSSPKVESPHVNETNANSILDELLETAGMRSSGGGSA